MLPALRAAGKRLTCTARTLLRRRVTLGALCIVIGTLHGGLLLHNSDHIRTLWFGASAVLPAILGSRHRSASALRAFLGDCLTREEKRCYEKRKNQDSELSRHLNPSIGLIFLHHLPESESCAELPELLTSSSVPSFLSGPLEMRMYLSPSESNWNFDPHPSVVEKVVVEERQSI